MFHWSLATKLFINAGSPNLSLAQSKVPCHQKVLFLNIIYLFISYTKLTTLPRKMRHVLPRLDVCRSLIAKYLHINIPYQNLKKVCMFCVSLLYVFCSWKLLPPVWWPPAGRGSTRGRLNCRLEDKIRTATCLQILKCASKCHLYKNNLFYWFR